MPAGPPGRKTRPAASGTICGRTSAGATLPWLLLLDGSFMSSIRFLSPLFVVPALALGAACAPVATVADFTAGEGGSTSGKYLGAGGGEATGGTGVSGSSSSSGSGGGGFAPYNGSYSYLCGGSHPVCSPDPGSDDCT